MLALRGSNVLLAETRQVRVVANPDVTVRYRAGQPLQVGGTVTVPEADINLERLDEGVSKSDDVVVLDPVDPKRQVDQVAVAVLAEQRGRHLAGLRAGLRLRGQCGQRRAQGQCRAEQAGQYSAHMLPPR